MSCKSNPPDVDKISRYEGEEVRVVWRDAVMDSTGDPSEADTHLRASYGVLYSITPDKIVLALTLELTDTSIEDSGYLAIPLSCVEGISTLCTAKALYPTLDESGDVIYSGDEQ